MKTKTKTKMKAFVLCGFLFLTAACSNQWREGDPGVTAEEMMTMLSEVNGAQGQATAAGGGVSEALKYKDDPNTTIFFADAPHTIGKELLTSVASLLSFWSFDFLGASGQGLSWETISDARVFFLTTPVDGGIYAGLIIGINSGGGGFQYHAFTGTGAVNGDEFAVSLSGGAGGLIARSYDVADGELAAVVQLRFWQADSAGNESYLGKISTLFGFGP
ncbi:MAG: hypothetical protein HC902_04715 [Calothrix sp. SM1_5_4]|nr:hypothetical protein [Calothrix sp. SM1_5_4]